MIEIYPNIEFHSRSPYGNQLLVPKRILWQGIHTCVEAQCRETNTTVIADLPVGHAVLNPCVVNLRSGEIFCPPDVRKRLGMPLLRSLQQPNNESVEMTVEKFRDIKEVIILNCIDYLYGHSLLKLFNAERHLLQNKEYGVIVIIQDFLRWLVPEGVAEVWTVKLPLSKASGFYTKLDERIHYECKRFDKIYASRAYSHPRITDIAAFTRIPKHDYDAQQYRITFIWRNDRPWAGNVYVIEAAKRMNLLDPLLQIQNRKIQRLFSSLREKLPDAKLTVTGFGTKTSFPSWIDDHRVDSFSEEVERRLCTVYSESRIVIGVHGSNMLLPSAHAGMTVDLMPKERWGNFAQDIVFQEPNTRLSSFRYRFFPVSTSIGVLAHSIATQIVEFEYFKRQMVG